MLPRNIVEIRAGMLLAALLLAFPGHALPQSAAQSFLKLIDRPRPPLAPDVAKLPDVDTFEQFHFSYASDSAQRVPGILIKPKSAASRRPVVIALHGTGGKKESELSLLKQLAGKGFIGVAIDGRYHGERARTGSGDYNQAILRAYRTPGEHPFLYDTVWDVMRLIDYLVTRPDVDPARIGLVGISKGGSETYLAAAVDPRISAAVPCIGVQSFRWALDNESWASRVGAFQPAMNGAAADANIDKDKVDAAFVRKFYDRVAPGIYSDFDGPAMLPLIAPRPLLVINGDSDPRTPLVGLMECVTAAKKAYQEKAAAENFSFLLQEKTGHQVRPESWEMAVKWFVRWLKP